MPGSVSRRRVLSGIGLALAAAVTPRRAGAARSATSRAARPAEPLTRGPRHHFFGYYDKCPWNRSGRFVLAMEVEFVGRQPEPGEPLTVGMVDLEEDRRFIPLDTTLAWCWQQGCMLQWLGTDTERLIIYNRFDDGRYVAVVRNTQGGMARVLPRPIYAVSSDGRQAVTLDFGRLGRLRPGYGYVARPDETLGRAAPEDAGIYWMDLRTGENRLIISLAWAALHRADSRLEGAEHWFNHLQFNPSGTRFVFLHRWRRGAGAWFTRLYTARPDGTDIRLLADHGMVSHFDWRDDDTILAWARMPSHGDRFYLFDVRSGRAEVFAPDVLTQDGHCSFSPDRRWVLVDTYPDRQDHQTLMLYHIAQARRIEIGRFFHPPALKGKPYRCDLHPRWSRDGRRVCIDGAHESTRQMYVLDVSDLTA